MVRSYVVAALLLTACGGATGASPEVASVPSSGSDVGPGTTAQAVTAAPVSSAPPAQPRALPGFCANAKSDAAAPSGSAKLVKDGFVFVEGPVWSDAEKAFFFSEMDFSRQGPNGPPSRIHKLVPPAAIDVFIAEAGSNGLAIDDAGLVACTHDTQTLSRYDLKTRARSAFVADFQGKHFNSPNDVALHSAGHAYFTDPDWQIGERKSETGITGVYFRSASGQVTLIDGELQKPNGITLSPDETRLYVGAVDGAVYVYPLFSDGSAGPRQKLADVKEPDGMAVDCLGRLYVTSHGPGEVVVLSPAGEVKATIKVAPRTTNVAFGGPDHTTLLITAGSGVYSLPSPVAGFPY
jgi:gluconolactonase